MHTTTTPTAHKQKIKTVEEIRSCYLTIKHLRPHLDEEGFIAQVQRQMTQGYHLLACVEEGAVKAVTGFRFLEFLAWGRVLYIDDLVTDAEARKLGFGTMLLKWVIDEAKLVQCDQVHLDSGPQRHEAHKFYLKAGFKIIGYHFALNCKD